MHCTSPPCTLSLWTSLLCTTTPLPPVARPALAPALPRQRSLRGRPRQATAMLGLAALRAGLPRAATPQLHPRTPEPRASSARIALLLHPRAPALRRIRVPQPSTRPAACITCALVLRSCTAREPLQCPLLRRACSNTCSCVAPAPAGASTCTARRRRSVPGPTRAARARARAYSLGLPAPAARHRSLAPARPGPPATARPARRRACARALAPARLAPEPAHTPLQRRPPGAVAPPPACRPRALCPCAPRPRVCARPARRRSRLLPCRPRAAEGGRQRRTSVEEAPPVGRKSPGRG
jgi:hypothetical protein